MFVYFFVNIISIQNYLKSLINRLFQEFILKEFLTVSIKSISVQIVGFKFECECEWAFKLGMLNFFINNYADII